jgi:hypothetical protein
LGEVTSTDSFISAAAAHWLVDGGSLQIRYLAVTYEGTPAILGATLNFGPRKIEKDNDFEIVIDDLRAGQRTFPTLTGERALKLFSEAVAGRINIARLEYKLLSPDPQSIYSETIQRDRWDGGLHMQIAGTAPAIQTTPGQLLLLDNSLREQSPPFDGMADLSQYLGLPDTRLSHQKPSIEIRIGMPVDLTLSTLAKDQLQLNLIAQKYADLKLLKLSVRAFPGAGLRAREHLTEKVKWGSSRKGFREGKLTISLAKADSALVLLTYAKQLVRRHWFVDPDKATNVRYVATQALDRDLKQLRSSLLETTDAARFERAVAALLYLLGFSPSSVLETQAPDLLVSSPSGALAIVECTTRISDFGAKSGKLVDRKHVLQAQLEASGHSIRVHAFLVTPQTRAQVSAEVERLQALGITLLCREEILEGLNRTRWPGNPDKMLEDSERRLTTRAIG